MNNTHTNEDLKRLQSLSLSEKILLTQARLIEWYKYWDNQCYVSFSGGKDSTVLAYITAQVCKSLNCKLTLWFSDTGLEYPELKEHVKVYGNYLKDKFNIEVETIIDYPKVRRGKDKGKRISFRDVILKYGYPIISKEIAESIPVVQRNPKGKVAQRFQRDSDYHKKYGDAWLRDKYAYLIDAPFKISKTCCAVMKERPSKYFEQDTGLKPIIGTMACESRLRKTKWLQQGCNAFDTKRPSSKPISFWTEQDILGFIFKYKIPIPSVYGEVIKKKTKYYTTGCNRTGCMFCGFGCHLEKEPNRFQRLKQTHPQIWEYCVKPINDGGLGLKEVLEYINVKTE